MGESAGRLNSMLDAPKQGGDGVMPQAFIVMQIGNPELDDVCARAMVPALSACGLDAKRVDKHNQGGLLKSEIIRFLESSDIILADLTNERPNCYLEVGYAMGIGKFKNLILTVREDHRFESPKHRKDGPKVHFDLSGYDLLFWDPDHIDAFREELEKRIRRRLAIIAPAAVAAAGPWDDDWVSAQRQTALKGLTSVGRRAFMEFRFALGQPKTYVNQRALDEAARVAPIHTFGWPIGIYMTNKQEFRPRPTAGGIVAEVPIIESSTYDYWSLRTNGDFYFLGSLFEDDRDESRIFFNTRIVRTTEALLYCARLYGRLSIDTSSQISVVLRHGGFRGRLIGSSNPGWHMFGRSPSAEDSIETQLQTNLGSIEPNLVIYVKQLLSPFFMLFDFFEVDDPTYQQIVDNFVAGKVI